MKSKLIKALLLSSLAASMGSALKAQFISYGTVGATIGENFDSMLPLAASNATWTDGATINGWYSYLRSGSGASGSVTNTSPTVLRVSNTVSAAGDLRSLYLFRSGASSTDGALGSHNLTTTGDITFGIRIRNTSGVTLDTITISYKGEQWYNGDSGNNNTLTPGYYIDSAGTLLTEQSVGTPSRFTAFSGITFNTPIDGDGAGVGTSGSLNGNDAANSVQFSLTSVSGLTWAPGTDIYIRWFNAEDSGAVDHGLAIDDFTFSATTSAVPEPSAFAALAGLAALAFTSARRRRSSR